MQRFPIVAILENIRSALNVGAMFRTADCAHIQKLVLAGITPYPPHNRIPKTALGATETVPWQHEQNSEQVIAEIAQTLPLIAIEVTPKAVSYYDFKFPKPVALVFGNEITGVSQASLKKSRAVVKIPMFGSKESLNVATTFGIILFEILRQWQQAN